MATFNFNKANLAAAQILSAITASQTSITVGVSESALFPTVPFFATIMPAGGVPNTLNSEIVQVTAVDTASGALTITRAQRGTTAKTQDEGAVIMNGVYIEDLAQSQAVGKSFFPATLTGSITGSYTVSDSMLPNAPEDGMSIRVVFGGIQEDATFTPKLRLNSGSYYNIYAGNNLTASHGTTNTPAMVKSGVIYELTYYNGAWYVLNLVANSSITSDNVDWATMKCGIVSNPVSNTIPANGRTRIAQITLPTGKYALIATASYWASAPARRCLYISFSSTTGGAITSMLNGAYGTATAGDTIEVTNTALVNITANQATVSAYVNSQDFSGTFTQWGVPSVLYFRVG